MSLPPKWNIFLPHSIFFGYVSMNTPSRKNMPFVCFLMFEEMYPGKSLDEWMVCFYYPERKIYFSARDNGGWGETKRRQVLLNKYILRRTDRNWKKNTYLLKYSLEYICVALEVPLCEEHWLMAFLINDNTICNPEHAWERVRINYTGRTDVSQDCLLQTRAYGYPLYLCTLSLMVALEMIYFISTTKL